jgi:hypothetical protein
MKACQTGALTLVEEISRIEMGLAMVDRIAACATRRISLVKGMPTGRSKTARIAACASKTVPPVNRR